MGESGGLLSSSGELSSRSYGSVRSAIMLSSIQTNSIKHKLEPSDTLQGLAVKYGVSVERLKRANKLWSNDSFHIKDTLLIPCSKEDAEVSNEPTASLDSFRIASDDENDSEEVKNVPEDKSNELSSSCKENKKELVNGYNKDESKSAVLQCYDNIFSKIDGQIKEYKESSKNQVGSESYNQFNEMMTKIDNQVQIQKANKGPCSYA